MIVVSDTTAISSLFKIGRLSLLHLFSKRILLPEAVWAELERLAENGHDLSEIRTASWISVASIENRAMFTALRTELDAGESEAIVLAIEQHADFLLIDEKDGRAKASELNVPTIGLIGVLLTLKENQLLPAVRPILDELRDQAGFYLSQKFYAKILASIDEL